MRARADISCHAAVVMLPPIRDRMSFEVRSRLSESGTLSGNQATNPRDNNAPSAWGIGTRLPGQRNSPFV
jgi:hypothetical protein